MPAGWSRRREEMRLDAGDRDCIFSRRLRVDSCVRARENSGSAGDALQTATRQAAGLPDLHRRPQFEDQRDL